MARYYATQYFTGDGQTTRWNISFAGARPDTHSGTTAWFKDTDVKAATIVQNADGTETETEVTVTIVGPTQVDIVPAIAKDVRFKVYRQSEREYPLVDFQDYSALTAAELDEAFRQTLFGVQELSDLATYSDLRSIRASTVAQSSVDDAKNAVKTANEAKSAASSANDTANRAEHTANDAKSLVDGAVSTANEAKSTADGIASTASDAKSIAESARSTANSANSTATGIAGTADDALATAKRAESSAHTANDTANEAKSTANSIDSKVQQAQSDAKNAQSTATEAKSIAQGIDNKASDAQHTASNAKEIAQSAANTAGNANNTANSAKSSADLANSRIDGLGSASRMSSSTAYVWDLAGWNGEAANTEQLVQLRNAYVENINKLQIQRGENSNGRWVKFPDGTMICSLDQAYKDWDKGYLRWTYPQSFTNKPTLHHSQQWTSWNVPWKVRFLMHVAGSGDATIYFYKDINGTLDQEERMCCSLTAIGSWK